MIGSNPDSQYKVPRIVGWEELKREERPVKKSYYSRGTENSQKTKGLVKTMKWEKHFRQKSMRKHASRPGYIRHDSIFHPMNCIEFHQWGNSSGRHYLGPTQWSLGALSQVLYGESQQLQHYKQRSTSMQVVAGTRVFVQNRNMSWNMGNVLSVWTTKKRLFYYRVAYEEDPLKNPGNWEEQAKVWRNYTGIRMVPKVIYTKTAKTKTSLMLRGLEISCLALPLHDLNVIGIDTCSAMSVSTKSEDFITIDKSPGSARIGKDSRCGRSRVQSWRQRLPSGQSNRLSRQSGLGD